MKKLSDQIAEESFKYLLPMLQRAVQANIDLWAAVREIEDYLGEEFSNMQDGIDQLSMSIGYDSGDRVTMDDLKQYLDGLEEE